jgi:CubicO group peptidase (beta-lactamase class C family)
VNPRQTVHSDTSWTKRLETGDDPGHPKVVVGARIKIGGFTKLEQTVFRVGLVREPPVGSYFDSTEPSLAEVVKSLNSTDLVYAPGTHTKYSNAGDTVAGLVLESVARKPYAQYLQETLLRPLRLESSSFNREPSLLRNLAKGYMWTYDGKAFQAPTFALGTARPETCTQRSLTRAAF